MTLASLPRAILVTALAMGTTACGAAQPAKAPATAPGTQAGYAATVVVESTETTPQSVSLSDSEARDEAAPAMPVSTAPPTPPPPSRPSVAHAAASPAPPVKRDPGEEVARDPALIVYAARFVMAVYQVDQGIAAVEKIARDNGGFLAKKQDREVVVRVPRARFHHVLAGVDLVGDVLHRDIEATDVTEEHVDLEVRIKNARAMQGRLKELLARANVKEALEIEKELHRVTGELESLEGKLKVLRDKIAYSTIAVTFQPRSASIQTPTARLPFSWLPSIGLPSLLSLTEDK